MNPNHNLSGNPSFTGAGSSANPSDSGMSQPGSGYFGGFATAPLLQASNQHPMQSGISHGVGVAAGSAWNSGAPVPVTASTSGWITRSSLMTKDPRIDGGWAYSRAPWFHPQSVKDDDLIDSYTEDGMLPGGLPRDIVSSWDWRNRIAVPPHLLNRRRLGRRYESLDESRAAMARIAYFRMKRAHNPPELVPPEYGFDLSRYRTYGEISYGANLALFDPTQINLASPIPADILLWGRPILRAEFRYLRRPTGEGTYSDRIRMERKARSRFGFFVPYTNIEIERLRPEALHGRYVPIPTWWSTFEVPRGCFAETPPCVAYIGSRLMANPDNGYWVLFLCEWAARVAAFTLWEVYDQFRIWYIPPQLRRLIRELDLYTVLGSSDNVTELEYLLGVIDDIDWSTVSAENVPPGNRSRFARSPGRQYPGAGDFVYFNPWEGASIQSADARALKQVPRSVPSGHPIGFMFSDGYYAQGVYEDPAVDNTPNHPGQGVLPASANTASANPAAGGSGVGAPPGWSVAPSASMHPQAAGLRAQLLQLGVPVPEGMNDIGQLLALASLSYPSLPPNQGGPSNAGGAGPSAEW